MAVAGGKSRSSITRRTAGRRDAGRLRKEYSAIRPTYSRFAERTAQLLQTLLQDRGIRYHAIEHRAKEIDSFIQKVVRPEKKYRNPLQEITDLAGVRVIAYDLSDLQTISDIVSGNFTLRSEESGDRGALLRPNEFGYRSFHFIAAASEFRAALPEWQPFQAMVVEIQLRTVLQHAWAAISHALQYKNVHDVPASLGRRLYRLSGLLELADEEFTGIARESREISADAAQAIGAGDLHLPIDRESLTEYLLSSPTPGMVVGLARRAGFLRVDDDDYESQSDPLAEIPWAASVVGMTSISDLDLLLTTSRESLFRYFSALIEPEESEWHGEAPFFLLIAIIRAHVNMFSVEALIEHGFSADIAQQVLNTARAAG